VEVVMRVSARRSVAAFVIEARGENAVAGTGEIELGGGEHAERGAVQ
jgi:hypothetical protein